METSIRKNWPDLPIEANVRIFGSREGDSRKTYTYKEKSRSNCNGRFVHLEEIFGGCWRNGEADGERVLHSSLGHCILAKYNRRVLISAFLHRFC